MYQLTSQFTARFNFTHFMLTLDVSLITNFVTDDVEILDTFQVMGSSYGLLNQVQEQLFE